MARFSEMELSRYPVPPHTTRVTSETDIVYTYWYTFWTAREPFDTDYRTWMVPVSEHNVYCDLENIYSVTLWYLHVKWNTAIILSEDKVSLNSEIRVPGINVYIFLVIMNTLCWIYNSLMLSQLLMIYTAYNVVYA